MPLALNASGRQASASAREQQLNRLVENMPLPWDSYRDHVQRAISNIWVSHKPDHSHEGAMHNDTAYGLLGGGRVSVHKTVDGQRQRFEDNLKVIEFTNAKATARHGLLSARSWARCRWTTLPPLSPMLMA